MKGITCKTLIRMPFQHFVVNFEYGSKYINHIGLPLSTYFRVLSRIYYVKTSRGYSETIVESGVHYIQNERIE